MKAPALPLRPDKNSPAIQVVVDRIRAAFSEMPAQLQVAARYILENPQEVALVSMREQARRAGIAAATMTRLAKTLGYAGFDELRDIYVGALRQSIDPFSHRAEELVQKQRQVGEPSLTAEMIKVLSSGVELLGGPEQREALARAARLCCDARKVYCAGQRSSYSVVYHFAYLYGYFSTKPVLLDGPGGIGSDALAFCGPEDAMLAISMEPSARKTIEAAEFARSRGVKLIAITNSQLSPVGRIADVNVLVDIGAPAFFDAMTSAFAACELLVAMIAAAAGDEVPAAVRLREEHRRDLGEWWHDK